MYTGILILLNEKKETQKLMETMTDKEKSLLIDYPIYRLFTK